MEERTRLHGYTQELVDQIRQDLSMAMRSSIDSVGSPTDLNKTYRNLYDTRFSLDFRERAKEERMNPRLLENIIETATRRVQYGNEIKEGSTIHADYMYSSNDGLLNDNDNFKDPYILTGRRNMMQLTADHKGFYDLSATGTGVNQGSVRYLTSDAVVDGNGAITHGSMDGKTPLMYDEVCRFLEHVPFDRRQMTFNNLMSAQCVTEPVKLACMTFGGWTFDDGFVVSKKFAETYKVEGADGQMRDLMVGDKISDMNGNKGVISLVVDPDMSLEEAREKGLEKEVMFFKNNPELDVVGAPFSPPSRFNGGTAREMMQNAQDLVDLDGKVREGCMGEAKIIITHMSVDEKTHMYTDDELRQGKGRRVSGQLAWALASQGAHAIMRECYGSNDGAVRNYREYLNVMGLDISETGVLHHGYKPHVNEKRQVFEMPEMKYNESNGKTRLDRRGMRNEFLQRISSEGGVMELPFPLKMPNGAELQHMNSNKTNVEYVKDEWEVAPILNEDGTIKRKGYTAHRKVSSSTRTVGDDTYGLPVLSSRLRTGQSSFDDVTSTHDYTKWYSTIFDKVIDYRVAQEKGDAAGMERAQNQAQAEYDKITNDLKSRVFSGKHNFIKESIMSVRKSNSATAVWTADPRLDLDTVAIGPMMAEKMGVKDGESVLIWRDPMLRDAGLRYMKVKVDSELHGAAINPVMDKCFDGDFDGDSVGLLKLTTKEANAEAAAKLTVAANLLDYGSLGKDGKYNLAINDGLDLKSVQYEHPELKELYDSIRDRANELFVDEHGRPRPQVDVREREALMKDLNGFVHSCFENGYATDALSYKDWPTHFATVEHTVASGAKGSYAKIEDYAKYCGVTYEMRSLGREEPEYMKVDDLFENPEISEKDVMEGLDEDFKALVESQSYLLDKNPDQTECIDLTSIKDHGKSLATLEDDVAVQYATGTKSLGTGIAGMYSQRGIRALRNICPKAVLELTYPVTQAILQVKHDPQAARRMYEIMRGPARHLWQGNKMEETMRPDGSRTWKVVREDGKPVQATPEEFVKQFVDIYTSKEGMNVSINPLYVEEVAKALTDPATGRVLDIDGSAVQKLASPMDQLAYEGDFTTACELAANERNLYSGKENGYFAPYIVLQNARNDNYNKKVGAVVRELKPLVQRDTQEKAEKSAWEDPKAKVRSTAEEMNAFFHQQREAENDVLAQAVVIVDEAVLAATPVD
ncbi:MAG: hypothetical protein HDQ88_10550 [Clostridia bacterium]|nr:hypothetical protein [Clostridia bacterium]